MMPLVFAQKDEALIIKKISGNAEVKQHLEDLGFNVGGEVSVVSTLGNNLIVKARFILIFDIIYTMIYTDIE